MIQTLRTDFCNPWCLHIGKLIQQLRQISSQGRLSALLFSRNNEAVTFFAHRYHNLQHTNQLLPYPLDSGILMQYLLKYNTLFRKPCGKLFPQFRKLRLFLLLRNLLRCKQGNLFIVLLLRLFLYCFFQLRMYRGIRFPHRFLGFRYCHFIKDLIHLFIIGSLLFFGFLFFLIRGLRSPCPVLLLCRRSLCIRVFFLCQATLFRHGTKQSLQGHPFFFLCSKTCFLRQPACFFFRRKTLFFRQATLFFLKSNPLRFFPRSALFRLTNTPVRFFPDIFYGKLSPVIGLQCLCPFYISTFAEPQNKVRTFGHTFLLPAQLVIQLRQLVRILFRIFLCL